MTQVICNQVGKACRFPCTEHGVSHEPYVMLKDGSTCDVLDEGCCILPRGMSALCVPTKEDES